VTTEQKNSSASSVIALVHCTTHGCTSATPLSPLYKEGGIGGSIALVQPAVAAAEKKKGQKRQMYSGSPPEDGVLIARTPGWELYHRPGKSTPPWQSLKLVTTGQRPCKGNFWITHNGQRLAVQTDASTLEKNEPEIYEWVHAVCVERFGR